MVSTSTSNFVSECVRCTETDANIMQCRQGIESDLWLYERVVHWIFQEDNHIGFIDLGIAAEAL